MAGDRAVERVGPRLERDLDRRDLAVLDDRALLVDAVALQRDVVWRRRRVLRRDRDRARAAGGLPGHEGELAAAVGVDLQLAALLGDRLAAAGRLDRILEQPAVGAG